MGNIYSTNTRARILWPAIRSCRWKTVRKCNGRVELTVGLVVLSVVWYIHYRRKIQPKLGLSPSSENFLGGVENKPETEVHQQVTCDNSTEGVTESVIDKDAQNYTGRIAEFRITTKNYLFYRNELSSEPDGDLIENIHREWKGKYELLESHHGYIQWLFPLFEKGLNCDADPLTVEELRTMIEDSDIRHRMIESLKLMLDFYGLKLCDENYDIVLADNCTERFENLNRRFHNNLRITRIIKCLVLFNLENLATSMVKVFAANLKDGRIPNCERSYNEFWLPSLSYGSQQEVLCHVDHLCQANRREKQVEGEESLNCTQLDAFNSFSTSGKDKPDLLLESTTSNNSISSGLYTPVADLKKIEKENIPGSDLSCSGPAESSDECQHDVRDAKGIELGISTGAKTTCNFESAIQSTTTATTLNSTTCDGATTCVLETSKNDDVSTAVGETQKNDDVSTAVGETPKNDDVSTAVGEAPKNDDVSTAVGEAPKNDGATTTTTIVGETTKNDDVTNAVREITNDDDITTAVGETTRNDDVGTSGETTNNDDVAFAVGGTTKNDDVTTSAGETTYNDDVTTAVEETAQNDDIDITTATGETTNNDDVGTSVGETTKNDDVSTSVGETPKNDDVSSSVGETPKNDDVITTAVGEKASSDDDIQ